MSVFWYKIASGLLADGDKLENNFDVFTGLIPCNFTQTSYNNSYITTGVYGLGTSTAVWANCYTDEIQIPAGLYKSGKTGSDALQFCPPTNADFIYSSGSFQRVEYLIPTANALYTDSFSVYIRTETDRPSTGAGSWSIFFNNVSATVYYGYGIQYALATTSGFLVAPNTAAAAVMSIDLMNGTRAYDTSTARYWKIFNIRRFAYNLNVSNDPAPTTTAVCSYGGVFPTSGAITSIVLANTTKAETHNIMWVQFR